MQTAGVAIEQPFILQFPIVVAESKEAINPGGPFDFRLCEAIRADVVAHPKLGPKTGREVLARLADERDQPNSVPPLLPTSIAMAPAVVCVFLGVGQKKLAVFRTDTDYILDFKVTAEGVAATEFDCVLKFHMEGASCRFLLQANKAFPFWESAAGSGQFN